jgi:hypothetical protein
MPALDDFVSGGLHTADEIEQLDRLCLLDRVILEGANRQDLKGRADLGVPAVNHPQPATHSCRCPKPHTKSTGSQIGEAVNRPPSAKPMP